MNSTVQALLSKDSKAVKKHHFCILLLSLILTSIIIEYLPSELGTSILALVYAIFGASILVSMSGAEDYTITFNTKTRLPGLSISAIILLSIFQILIGNYQTYQNALSALLLLSLSIFNIFIIPIYIRKLDFFLIMSRLSLFFVLIPLFLIPLAMVSEQVMSFLWLGPREIGTFTYPVLLSITKNQNSLGQILFVGLLCTIGLYRRSLNRRELYISTVIFVGLILTHNRYSWLAVTTAGVVFSAYQLQGHRGIRRVLWLGGTLLIVILTFLISLYPQDITITLSGRLPLWTASIEAILQKPFNGHGFGSRSAMIEQYIPDPRYAGIGPHNGYLAMTLQLGILGGLAYILLLLGSLLENLMAARPDVILIMLLVGFATIMLFANVNIFTRGVHPILFTLVIGYLLSPNR